MRSGMPPNECRVAYAFLSPWGVSRAKPGFGSRPARFRAVSNAFLMLVIGCPDFHHRHRLLLRAGD